MKRILLIIGVILVVGLAIWFAVRQSNRNKDQAADTVMSVTAFNQTKNTDAVTNPASPRDTVVYTLTIENKGEKVAPGYVVEVNIADISQLATLIDAAGANYNSSNNSLIWTPLDIPAMGSIEKKFTVRVKDPIPANTDGVMSVQFNNEVQVAVRPGQQVATPPASPSGGTTGRTGSVSGDSTYRAPKTGPELPLIVALASAATLAIALFLRRH